MIRRASLAGVLAVAAGLALSACTPPAAPTAWQRNVQTIAQQASSGDYASALASLDALEAEVTARRDAGEITSEEAEGILTRIATVRADLTTLVPAPTPEPVQTTVPAPADQQDVVDDGGDDTGGNGNGNGNGGGPSDKKPDDEKGPGNGKGSGKKDG